MNEQELEALLRWGARAVVNDTLEAQKTKQRSGQGQASTRFEPRLCADVEVHPLWWAISGEPNPNLRIVREAA